MASNIKSIKVVFTKGVRTRRVVKGTLIENAAKQALSQNIKVEIIKSSITKELADKEGKKVRQMVASVSKAYYMAMLKGSLALVNNSGVPAQWDDSPEDILVANPKHPAFRRKDLIKKRVSTVGLSQYFNPIIYQKQILTPDKNTPENLPGNVYATVKNVQWKKLTERYALRRPKSKIFFRKSKTSPIRGPRKTIRPHGGDPSARFAFLVSFNSVVNSPKVNTISAYYKGTVKVSELQQGGSRLAEFKINYPPLGDNYDFLRKAFISGMHNTSVDPHGLNNHGNRGIPALLWAERFRPLMRPYSSDIGRSMKLFFDTYEKNIHPKSEK